MPTTKSARLPPVTNERQGKTSRQPSSAQTKAPDKAEKDWQADLDATLKVIGASKTPQFNRHIADALVRTAWWPENQAPDAKQVTLTAVVTAVAAFRPTDEIEAMIAAQAVAMHHATMECAGRAMLAGQPFEIAQGLRKSAANMSRTFVELLSALDRKRGKSGQQRVTVEHVHVHAGGKAIVGAVGTDNPGQAGGGGAERKKEERPRATPAALEHDVAIGPIIAPLRGADARREPVPIARHDERPMPDAWRRQHRPEDG